QGPMLLQTLNLIDPAELAKAGHNSPAAIHIITEAVKLAAADREAYYGDPCFPLLHRRADRGPPQPRLFGRAQAYDRS
ncbi:MAG: gamma-glutamyltransferase, partial [Acetobacteraceae bacterium]